MGEAWPPAYVRHGSPPCDCGPSAENPECSSHGYEAVIARLETDLERSIRLDALAGPAEVMAASGLTNRGSLDWAMQHRGFPRPVKILQRVRIWDLNEVRAWKDRTDEGAVSDE